MVSPSALGGLEVNDQVEPRGLLDWQVAGAGPLQDLVNVDRGPPEVIPNVGSIGCEPAGLREPQLEHSRKAVLERAFDDRLPVVGQQPRGRLQQRAGAVAAGGLERGIEICRTPHRQRLKLHAEQGRRRFCRTELQRSTGLIPEDGDAGDGRDHLFEKL